LTNSRLLVESIDPQDSSQGRTRQIAGTSKIRHAECSRDHNAVVETIEGTVKEAVPHGKVKLELTILVELSRPHESPIEATLCYGFLWLC
jgi:hypothetical protein